MSKEKKPHVHAEVIGDWAKGFFVEAQNGDGTWSLVNDTPLFSPTTRYRRAVNAQRPHYKLINAFAAGEEIEFFDTGTGRWERANSPTFDRDTQYRIRLDPFTRLAADIHDTMYMTAVDVEPYTREGYDNADAAETLIHTAKQLAELAAKISHTLATTRWPSKDETE